MKEKNDNDKPLFREKRSAMFENNLIPFIMFVFLDYILPLDGSTKLFLIL